MNNVGITSGEWLYYPGPSGMVASSGVYTSPFSAAGERNQIVVGFGFNNEISSTEIIPRTYTSYWERLTTTCIDWPGHNEYHCTVHLWIMPMFESSIPSLHNQFVAQGLGWGGIWEVYWSGTIGKWVISVGNSGWIYIDGSFHPGDWIYMRLVWDHISSRIRVEIDGIVYDYVGWNGLATAKFNYPYGLHIGQRYSSRNRFEGIVKYRTSRATEDSMYNSGAGDAYFHVVDPLTNMVERFTQHQNDYMMWHYGTVTNFATPSGGGVSCVTDGTAYYAFDSGDRVTYQDGGGLYRHCNVVGIEPSGTSTTPFNGILTVIAIDAGTAGVADATPEAIGRGAGPGYKYNGVAGLVYTGNDSTYQPEGYDISMSAQMLVLPSPDNRMAPFGKYLYGNTKDTGWYVGSSDTRPDEIFIFLRDTDDNEFIVHFSKDNFIQDYRERGVHVAVTIDRDNEDNCLVYINGVPLEVTEKEGTLAALGTLDSDTRLCIGAAGYDVTTGDGGYLPKAGITRDVKLYMANGDIWSEAEIRYQAENPFD